MSNKANSHQSEMSAQRLSNIQLELDRSCEGLDGEILSRLNKICYEAADSKRSNFRFNYFAFASACTIGLIVMFTILTMMNGNDQLEADSLIETEIWASSESYELLDDLEFYQWLNENEPSA